MNAVDTIVNEVLRRLAEEKIDKTEASSEIKQVCLLTESENIGIPAEMSARHVHLTSDDMKALFGQAELPVSRMISQPGQYLSTLRVRLTGPKGSIDNVAILGPVRAATQVEISATDARMLGINAPIRLSGDTKGAARVYIQAGENMLCSDAAIIAKRHLHMLPSDAAVYNVCDGQSISVRVLGARPLILEDVSVRVTDKSALALHIDTDEANAAGLGKGGRCEIIGKEGLRSPLNASRDESTTESTERSDKACSVCSFEGKLLTEEGVRELYRKDVRELRLKKHQLVTPLARDTAKAMGLKLIMEEN